MSEPSGREFVEALLSCAEDRATACRLRAVLAHWHGARVRISATQQRRARVAAAAVAVSSGVGSAEASALLAARFGLSLRQARRYVAAARSSLAP